MAVLQIPERDPTECPVCGAFKFSHDEFCRDCAEQQRVTTQRRQQAARDKRFGPLWPREG